MTAPTSDGPPARVGSAPRPLSLNGCQRSYDGSVATVPCLCVWVSQWQHLAGHRRGRCGPCPGASTGHIRSGRRRSRRRGRRALGLSPSPDEHDRNGDTTPLASLPLWAEGDAPPGWFRRAVGAVWHTLLCTRCRADRLLDGIPSAPFRGGRFRCQRAALSACLGTCLGLCADRIADLARRVARIRCAIFGASPSSFGRRRPSRR